MTVNVKHVASCLLQEGNLRAHTTFESRWQHYQTYAYTAKPVILAGIEVNFYLW